MRLYFLLLFLLLSTNLFATRVIHDLPVMNIHDMFQSCKAKYILRYKHHFNDTLIIPKGCVLIFDGGSLNGPIKFHNTFLKGKVNLKGASITGTITNQIFDASWLCAMDGVTDDAPRINEMIEVCGKVFFPTGNYRLISAFNPEGKLPEELHSSVQGHIAICKDNVTLEGEQGTVFVTGKPLITICVFSQPNDIEQSIRDIKIQNINFKVDNDGLNFHEFMHTIKLMGVRGITIRNCKFNDFWGDAICLSHYGDTPETGERTRNQNVKILNNQIIGGAKHSNRNGISVVNGKDVIIRGNIIKNTSRKDMPGGIDIEPNNSAYTIENIKIEKNTFEGVWGTVGAVGIVLLRDQAPAYNVRVVNNIIRDCSCGISLAIKTEMSSGKILIKDNFIAGDTRPYNFVGSGSSKDWIICGNVFERPCTQSIPGNIKVDNQVIKNNKKKD